MTASLTSATLAHTEGSRRLVLWCPDWPVRAAATSISCGERIPVAVFAAGRVHACSATARRAGVRRGLRTREAQARCPDLLVLQHDPDLDERAFAPLVAAVTELAATVQVLRPGTMALPITGVARYHGDETVAAALLAECLVGLGVDDLRIGIADATFTAEQAARLAAAQEWRVIPPGGDARFLAPLPVDCLARPELESLLRRLGLRTLGEFAGLDERDVHHRFGPDGLAAHRQASGTEATPFVAHRPPHEHETSVHLDTPLRRAEQVVRSSRDAVIALIRDLDRARLACTAAWIEVGDDEGRVTERRWAHPGCFDAHDLLDRIRWQLDAEPPASPVVSVRIVPDELIPAGDLAEGLWGERAGPHVQRAASAVQGMLGRSGIGMAALAGGRAPGERQVFVPWGDAPPRSAPAPWPGHVPPPQPATIYPRPREAILHDARGESIALTARGALTASPTHCRPHPDGPMLPVSAWAGPWESEQRWWAPGEARRVARVQVVAVDGSAWLLALDGGRWWTEARYD